MRRLIVCLVLAIPLAPPASAQRTCYLQGVESASTFHLVTTEEPPVAVSCTTTDGLAEVDVTGDGTPELLSHDVSTIRWQDVFGGAGNGILPLPPGGQLVSLVGLQAIAGPERDLIALVRQSGSTSLYVLDLIGAPATWILLGPLTSAPSPEVTTMAAADVVGSSARDLVISDGTFVVAFDGGTGALAGLPAPPGPVRSLVAMLVRTGSPALPTDRRLGANVGQQTFHYDRVAAAWSTLPVPQQFAVRSSVPFDFGAPSVIKVDNVVLAEPLAATAIQLTDVAATAGSFAATASPGGDFHCPGAVFGEIDGDTWPDIYLVRGAGAATSQANQLFLGSAAGTFTQQAGMAAADTGNGAGALLLDIDNDGLRDLFVVNMDGENRLYRQQLGGTFNDVTPGTDPTPADPAGDLQEGLRFGIPDLAAGGRCPPKQDNCLLDDSLSAAAGDVNRDGLVDIFVGNHLCCEFKEGERDVLYLQTANGTFTDITLAAGIATATEEHGSAQAVTIADMNNDGWPDIYVAAKVDGPHRDRLFLNDANWGPAFAVGTFTEYFAGQPNQQLGNVTPGAMGVEVADIDNDGDLDVYESDLFVALDMFPTAMDLYRNTLAETGIFGLKLIDPNPLDAPRWGWGMAWVDFDNDRDLDVYLATQAGLLDWLFQNEGAFAFTAVGYEAGVRVTRSRRGVIPADYDRDGRVDLLVVDKGQPAPQPIALYRNRSTAGNWIAFRLIGDPTLAPAPFLSTRDAVGARLDVTAGGVSQRRDVTIGGHTCAATHDQLLHVGLGAATSATVTIRWPSGRTTTLAAPAINQVHTVIEM